MSKKTALDRTPLFTLLLIRHGQTDYNLERRFYGRIDTPVNATGVEQAAALSVELKDRHIDAIYSSPAKRAYMTAEPTAAGRNLTIQTDERLWEMNFGRWEGLTFEEAEAVNPEAWASWRRGETMDAPHGGETYTSSTKRISGWLESIRGDYTNNETVAVFAHGAILQCLLCDLMGTKLEQLWPYRFGNTTVAELAMFRTRAVMVGFG